MTKNQCLVNFSEFFNDADEIMVVIDSSDRIIDINHTALMDLCYTREEIINNHISTICSDNSLKFSINNSISKFNTKLLTKYKKYILAKGKINFCKFNNRKALILKFEKIDHSITKSMFLDENLMNINYGNVIKDLSGKYVSVNSYFEKFFNKKKENIIGKYDSEIWDNDTAYRLRREDLYVMSTKNNHIVNSSMVVNDEIKHYQSFKSPLYDKEKKIVGISCVIKDITNNIELKNELMVQNEQLSILYKTLNTSVDIDFKKIFENLYDNLSILLNVDWLSVYLYNMDNESLEYYTSCGISNYYFENCIKKNLSLPFLKHVFNTKKSIPMTEISQYEYIFPKEIIDREGIKYIACYPIIYKKQTLGVINFACRSEEYTYNWDNNFVEIICKNIALLLQNSMLYKKLEKKLNAERIAREKIDLYFDTTLDFFCIVNKQGEIIKIGKELVKVLGWEESIFYSSKVYNFLHEEDSSFIKNILRLVKDKETRNYCLRAKCFDGKYVDIDWNIKYLADENIYICSGRNLIEKKDLENKKKLMEEYINIEKLKSEFLTNISHELRTPLAIIYGAVHMIEEKYKSVQHTEPEKIEEYILSAKKNTFRLLRLINNIIDATNLNAGCMPLNIKLCDIVKVIRDMTKSISLRLESMGVNLVFSTDIKEKYINIDIKKIEKVLLNLLSNSVKYSREGIKTVINIRLYTENDKIYISVKDNGIGIEESYLDLIFNMFTQENSDCMTREAEGSGIGLYLVKSLLQMQGANISVKSIKNEGSEFIIEFPDNNEEIDETNIIESDFSVKIENFDMEFSDIAC